MSTKEEFAYATVRALYGITIVSFVAIGVQLFMCLYGLSLFFETPKHIRKGRVFYILISWTIFILFCFSQTGDAYQMFNLLYRSSANDPFSVLKLRHEDDHTWWRLGTSSSLFVVNWLTDGLLVYRSFIIWTERRWVCILPFLTYLASVGMSLLTLTSLGLSKSLASRLNTNALSAWIYLSVSVNFLVTSLICFRLLRLRKQLIPYMSLRDRGLYLGIVAILVESAVPLTVSGIAFAIVSSPKTVEARIPNGMFLCLWFSLNAICPQLIIFRVTCGRSWLRHPETRTAGNEAVSTNIAFVNMTREHGSSTIAKHEHDGVGDIEDAIDSEKVIGVGRASDIVADTDTSSVRVRDA